MKAHFRTATAALMLAVSGAAMVATTAPAAADEYGTDAFAGAAVGALVGSLLLDSNRDQYYYVNNYHRVYVSDGYAERWHHHYGYGGYRGYGGRVYQPAGYYGGGWHGDHGWHGGDRGWHGDHGGWHH